MTGRSTTIPSSIACQVIAASAIAPFSVDSDTACAPGADRHVGRPGAPPTPR
jgi:hypothetical protein